MVRPSVYLIDLKFSQEQFYKLLHVVNLSLKWKDCSLFFFLPWQMINPCWWYSSQTSHSFCHLFSDYWGWNWLGSFQFLLPTGCYFLVSGVLSLTIIIIALYVMIVKEVLRSSKYLLYFGFLFLKTTLEKVQPTNFDWNYWNQIRVNFASESCSRVQLWLAMFPYKSAPAHSCTNQYLISDKISSG